MAAIARFGFWRHLRSDASMHVLFYRGGALVKTGRGLAFWFTPLSASIAEVACDDRDQPFLFHARSSDFQDVTAQGVVTYRVTDPATAAKRVDFSIDLRTGVWQKTPLEQISGLLTQSAQQTAWAYLSHTPLKQLLADGVEQVRGRIQTALAADPGVQALGLEIVSVRVASVAPTADLEKALQAPVREHIQQQADEAAFQRRALAVEKERAIQENELQNQIELAKRKDLLIAQEGQNARHQAKEEAEAARIAADGAAARRKVESAAQADAIRVVEEARNAAEGTRVEIYRDMPSHVLLGLAAREAAGKLTSIQHVNITPDLLGPLLANLAEAGTKRLEATPAAPGGGEAQTQSVKRPKKG